MRAGRKRKVGVKRTESGRISRAGEIHPETLAVRERELARDGIILSFVQIDGGRVSTKITATDRLSGFTLGRLYLRWQQDHGNPGSISRDQFEAGEAWASLAIARKSIDDSRRLGPKSPSFSLISAGRSFGDMDPDRVERIKSRWSACDGALNEVCQHHGWQVKQVLYGVCLENWPIENISEMDFGLLRTGLNTVGRVLR